MDTKRGGDVARIRDPARDKAKELYLNNKDITNREIANILGVDEKKIATWKIRDNWKCSTTEKKNVVQQNKKCSTTNEKNKINWLKLENEYVTDITPKPITLKALSEKHDINFNVLQNYSADNDWTGKRKKFIRSTLEKTQEKLSDKTSDVMADILNNINTALLQATEELNIYEEVNGFGKLVKHETETVRTNKLGTLVKALTSLQKIEIEKSKIDKEDGPEEKAKSQLDKLEELLNGVELDD